MSILGFFRGNPALTPPHVEPGALSPAETLPAELWIDILSRTTLQTLVNVGMVGPRFNALAEERTVLAAVVGPGATIETLRQRARIERRIDANESRAQRLPLFHAPPSAARVVPTRDPPQMTSWPHLNWPSADLFIERPCPRRSAVPRRPAGKGPVIFWGTETAQPTMRHTEQGAGGVWQSAVASQEGNAVAANNASRSLVTLLCIGLQPARTVLLPLPNIALRYVIDASGHRLAIVGDDGHVHVKPKDADWQRLQVGARPNGVAKFLTFSADGARIAAAYADGSLRVWNTGKEASEPLVTIQPPRSPTRYVAMSRDGTFVAAGSNDGVALWNVASPDALLYSRTEHVQTFAFSPGGEAFVVGTANRVERLDLNTMRKQGYRGPGDIVRGIGVSPCGSFVLAYDTSRIRFWSVQGDAMVPLKGEFSGGVGEARWSARPGRVNVIDGHGRVLLLDYNVAPAAQRDELSN